MSWGAFFLQSFHCIRDSIRPVPIQDKKMVDGKGGSLKTIHHYKTERGLMNAPPFRFFPDDGRSGGNRKHPSIFKVKPDNHFLTVSIPKEKKSCSCSCRSMPFFLPSLPEYPPPVPSHPEPGKNYTRQPGRGQGALFSPCRHTIQISYFSLASRKSVSISMAARH